VTAVCAEEAVLAHVYGNTERALLRLDEGKSGGREVAGARMRGVGQTQRGRGRDEALHCTLLFVFGWGQLVHSFRFNKSKDAERFANQLIWTKYIDLIHAIHGNCLRADLRLIKWGPRPTQKSQVIII